jgi:hypothetical protein
MIPFQFIFIARLHADTTSELVDQIHDHDDYHFADSGGPDAFGGSAVSPADGR